MDDIIQYKKKLQKLKRSLEGLRSRSGNLRHKDLKGLAEQLGRQLAGQRGKEPTFINPLLPQSRPISIPNHPGSLNRFTAEGILDQLEEDIFAIEEELDRRNGAIK